MGQHVSGYFTNITNMSNNNNNNNNPSNDNDNNNPNDNPNNDNSRSNRSQNRRKRYNAKKIPKDLKLTSNDLQLITNDVFELVLDWFPDLHERTYFLPPVHMNKVTYKTSDVGGRRVESIQATPESDWRDDEVMQRTLACLRALTDSRKEPMVVLLQMQQDNYMHKPCYAAAAAHYPRPVDLPTNLRRGDFDLLFLHRTHGLVVAEIKSVGWRPDRTKNNSTGEEQDDETVVKKVLQAVKQLSKAHTVLKHLTSDLKHPPPVTRTLILPNVTSSRLLGLLHRHPQLAQDFCDCFNQPDVESAVSVCLCSEQMTSLTRPADVTSAILQQLTDWWLRLLGSGENESTLSDSEQDTRDIIYHLLVARFCGPASTVQVHCVRPPRLEFRTLGHAVQEVGERMVDFVLFPEQLALLQELEEECVYLSGPPGTGKTLMLTLVALQWCRRGYHVHVASTSTFSEAATHLLYYQVVKTLEETGDKEAASRIHIHLNGNSTNNVHTIIDDLVTASKVKVEVTDKGTDDTATCGQSDEPGSQEGAQLSNNLPEGAQLTSASGSSSQGGEEALPEPRDDDEETRFTSSDDVIRASDGDKEQSQLYLVVDEVGEKFREFYSELRAKITGLHLWAASYRKEFRPSEMEERSLSACLRSTPTVMRRMETAISFAARGVDAYEDRRQSYLSVSDGPAELFLSHEGHGTERAMDCRECGICIAQCLQHDLGIGKKPKATAIKTPSTLQFSDVMVIPDYYQDIPELCDEHGDKPASGIVRGLRAGGVPAYVVTKDDAQAVKDLARQACPAVAVVAWGVSNGLERKVVVSVGQGRAMGDGRVSGVLHGASRCVSQLVYVKVPE